MANGPPVTQSEHEKAVFANRMLYEIGDDDIWRLREALLADHNNRALLADLRAKLTARYGKQKRRIGPYAITWRFICQLLHWS